MVMRLTHLHTTHMPPPPQTHTHTQGGNLPDDQLDGMFRGSGGDSLQYYKRNPKAGATMHSKIGWKSTLARHDQLAVSDPNALAKSIEVRTKRVTMSVACM